MKMTKEKHLELVLAWWDKRLEVYDNGDGKWRIATYPPEENSRPDFYRIRPQPNLRPWKPEEVPVGAQIRNNETQGLRCLIVASGRDVLTVISNKIQHFTFEQAFRSGEHSTDGGKTWKPCGVEGEQ